MGNFLLALQALQLVLPLVAEVEQLFGHLPGADKKATVVQLIPAAITSARQLGAKLTDEQASAVQTAATSVVDAVVAGFNAAGVFQHAAPAKP